MIWIGFDPREAAAFAVARRTLSKNVPRHWPVYGLVLAELQARGLYTRPIEYKPTAADGPLMWDTISDAPMSTEHANARFLVPYLASYGRTHHPRWALFMDGDMLVKGNVGKLFETLNDNFAVYCVKHQHEPKNTVKMDGQVQTAYSRKNWSSFMFFNLYHESNKCLTPELVNQVPGRDLHRFFWLRDEEIGELDPSWNFLVGHTDPKIQPNVIHWTDGVPNMRGYEKAAYADEWREELCQWAA